MAITSSTTTALDVPTLVSQLMAVERRPIDTLNTQITSYQTKISSFGTLSGLVSSFQTAAQNLGTTLQKLAATPSDPSVFSATAGSTAVPGNYTVEVSKLAQSQSLVAAGQASSTAAIGNGTATTVTFDFGTIGGGTLTNGVYSGAAFTSNGNGTASITIDSTNNTLEGIRDAINSAAMGVTATIVNDGSGTPYRLALTSGSSGASNSMKITTSGGDGSIDSLLAYDPAGTQNLTQTIAAQNADLTVNGIAITSASNTVSEAIQGVTLTLTNTTAAPASLTVARDTTAINTAASGFVDAYNALAGQIKSRSAYATNGSAGGALAGDGTLRVMQDQLRSIFNTPASGGTLTSLAEVGIAFQKDGSLSLDSSKLNSAISANFSDVTNLFSSSTGFATRLADWAQSTLDPGGLIDTRTQSLNKYVQDRNDEIDRLENQMTALQKKYTAEYTNLNLLLSRMNSTSTYLTQQLSSTSSK
ncbi:MAG: flagellar filament capping protein FliD [Thiobacillus sp.]|jgi:flagellar hook-associated protein 2|uniref:flagellar filament capping protein FliD n=1 Tax=unclassified Thiobacillus TaxID=2646513 RepID=UPI0008695C8E|nr:MULTISPECIES: flagellar filament capping protein FliD [unclassified Thiobacillus]ODU85797.1 MAG: flagellar hook protein [Thiobacillus sp. SCN 65-179]MBN8772260.1 flagellar filament capping protein FliD [Thiobacillus sp.]MBN8780718.1 flagellar filament capping protein FliD [Thiobacillus sp.]ODV02650.1 MAG: flagellar hook protein [Thiobacillus sp. SCN 63-57]OJY57887.1 MAG: flagellar hook protein [Thiobacillus sp. 0-1251]